MYLGGNSFLLKTTAFHFTDKEFEQFCLDNKELRIERDAEQNILIMSPTHSLSGSYNNLLSYLVTQWNIESGFSGVVFDSSSGFTLPDGSMRSPDVSWISKDKWDSLSDDQHRSFAPICPEFVIELKSESDSSEHLQHKMEEVWLKNGTILGLLIDPDLKHTYRYQLNSPVQRLEGFNRKVSCNPILKGFELDLSLLLNL